MGGFEIFRTVFLVAFTIAALITDLRAHRLPNWLTVPAFLLALVFHSVNDGLHGFAFAMGGFAVGFGILFVLFLIGGGRGGDVKLMGALGAWLGAKMTLGVFLLSPIFAVLFGLTSLGGMVLRDGLSKVKKKYFQRPADGAKSKAAGSRGIVPYAVPVALSTWLVLIWNLCIRSQE